MEKIKDSFIKISKIVLFFRNRVGYEAYFESQLRARYMDLEGDFRTIIALNLAKESDLKDLKFKSLYVVDLLKATKTILEKEKLKKVDLLSVSSLLDQVEQCMVWITPYDMKIAEINSLRLDLSRVDSSIRDVYGPILDKCKLSLYGSCGIKP